MLLWCLLVIQLVSAHWYNPVADPKATVIFGNARFTVLTPQLIRIEYNSNKTFEDRSTLAILNRRLPLTNFFVSNDNGTLEIETSVVRLYYDPSFDTSSGFSSTSISISSPGFEGTWVPYLTDSGNLHGTIRTLEGKGSFS